mgnify:CR=1 FL=1
MFDHCGIWQSKCASVFRLLSGCSVYDCEFDFFLISRLLTRVTSKAEDFNILPFRKHELLLK